MIRRICYFSGRVQGVGFRYTAQNIAMRYRVSGYVRNTPDGRVELLMEGDPRELDSVLNEIQSRMEGFVIKVHADDLPATGEFTGFTIRH